MLPRGGMQDRHAPSTASDMTGQGWVAEAAAQEGLAGALSPPTSSEKGSLSCLD